jgi:hypothetical protein
MLRMVNLLIALSLGVHREQLLHRMGLTWPRPFLFRPLESLLALKFKVRKCQCRSIVVKHHRDAGEESIVVGGNAMRW